MTETEGPACLPDLAPMVQDAAGHAWIPAIGWAAHYTGTGHGTTTSQGSDKYYRTVLLGSCLFIHYGRRGSKGQFVLQRYASRTRAAEAAADALTKKIAKGYWLETATIDWLAPLDAAVACLTSAQGARNAVTDTTAAAKVIAGWEAIDAAAAASATLSDVFGEA